MFVEPEAKEESDLIAGTLEGGFERMRFLTARIWTSQSIASARAILTLTYGLLITAASVGLSLLFDFEKKATGRPAGS